MTDQPLSDDELLSSSLDGELTVEQVAQLDARLAAEPALAARRDELRGAMTLASTEVAPLAPGDADAMIAAALAASASTTEAVTDLTMARQRRRSAWPARIATAAAGVVALAIGVAALQAIDTGSDSDDAGSGDAAESTFDGDMAGDDDGLTAADTATEAAMLDQAPAETAEGDFDDLADDDMADDASADGEDESTGGATPDGEPFDAEAYFAQNGSAFRLFDDDPSFDPLPDDLGSFDSSMVLSEELSVAWSAYVDQPTTTTVTPPDDAPSTTTSARASERLDAFGLSGCDGVALVVEYFEGQTVLAADYSSAIVDGEPSTIALFSLGDGVAEVLVIDQSSCAIRPISLFS